MSEQPEALRSADICDDLDLHSVAAELRRLHEEVQEQCRINGMGAEREVKLMAEKQELLEALKAADWYIGQLEPFVYGADDDGVHEEHAKVRAAIAKAEGETK